MHDPPARQTCDRSGLRHKTHRLTGEALEVRQMLAADVSVLLPYSEGLFANDVGAALTAAPQAVSTGEIQPIADAAVVGSGSQYTTFRHGVTATDAAGNYVVVWYGVSRGEAADADEHLYAQRYNAAGEAVGERILVSDGTSGHYLVAMAADGSFVVAWDESQLIAGFQLDQPVHVKCFDDQGHLLGDATISSSSSLSLYSLAMGDNGTFVIGYAVVDSSPYTYDELLRGVHRVPQLFVQSFNADGVAQGEPVAFGPGNYLQVAAAADGSFAALAYDSRSTAERALFVYRYDADGTTRGAPIRVTWLEGQVLSPVLAMDATGNFVVVWQHQSGNDSQILAQRFDSEGVKLRGVISVSEGETPVGSLPLVTMAADGSFVVGWAAPRTGPMIFPAYERGQPGLWFRAFDATGAAQGAAYQVGIHYQLARASIAVSDAGELAITWALETTPRPTIYAKKLSLPRELAIDLNGEPPGVGYEGNFIPGGLPVAIGNSDRLAIRAAGATTLVSATASIGGYLPGDLLEVVTNGTSITASYVDGVLTLSGVASIADYQQVLRSLTYRTTANRAVGTTVDVSVTISDGTRQSEMAVSKISIHVPGRSSVAGRRIFYNNSSFDGNDPAANSSDDAVIATDKTALLPGQTATFANYTSYTRGINGIMIDLAGQHGMITADDFIFRIGNSSYTGQWGYAPDPLSVEVRPGAGIDGSDRLVIIWKDGAIKNLWLQVIVLDNGNTGLAEADTFFFGNAVGETGNEAQQSRVTTGDVFRALNQFLRDPQGQAALPITSPLDFDRDGRLRVADIMAALNQILAPTEPLERIWISAANAQSGAITAGLTATFTLWTPPVELLSADLTWAEPQAAVFHDWEPDDEAVEYLLPPVAPAPLLLEPDDL